MGNLERKMAYRSKYVRGTAHSKRFFSGKSRCSSGQSDEQSCNDDVGFHVAQRARSVSSTGCRIGTKDAKRLTEIHFVLISLCLSAEQVQIQHGNDKRFVRVNFVTFLQSISEPTSKMP